MTEAFVEEIERSHKQLYGNFAGYRDQITDVLFYGKQISRSDLCQGKDEFVESINQHVESIQQILLPAVSGPNKAEINPADVLAFHQKRLRERIDHLDETIDFFADPERAKDERNNAAREALKDLYRLDDFLNTYFQILETIFLRAGDNVLDEDEKQELLDEIDAAARV